MPLDNGEIILNPTQNSGPPDVIAEKSIEIWRNFPALPVSGLVNWSETAKYAEYLESVIGRETLVGIVTALANDILLRAAIF